MEQFNEAALRYYIKQALEFDLGKGNSFALTRLYETEGDLQQMQDLLMRARSRSDDWRYPHIGDLAWGFFMVACHLKPQDFIRLWHADGNLAGYAMLGEDPSFDYQVLPDYAWRGIESEALAWAETRLSELRKRGDRLDLRP